MKFEDVLEGAEVHNPEVDGMQERVDAAFKLIEWDQDIKSEEESFEELDKWWNEKLGMNVKTREKLADTLFESGQEPRNIILAAVYLGYKLAEKNMPAANSQTS
jgi:hypothetical protein